MLTTTNFMFKENSVKGVEQKLNEGGKKISRWYNDNFLKGNYDKYKITLIGSKKKKDENIEINVNIDGINIKSNSELKLLGVTLDDHLNYCEHISDICKKASKKVNVLVRFRNMVPEKAKLTLYKPVILANLTYCHTVWHFCKAPDARKLEKIQERAVRAIYNNKSDSYEELLAKAKLPSLANRRLQDILILMYKVKNAIVPQHVSNFS